MRLAQLFAQTGDLLVLLTQAPDLAAQPEQLARLVFRKLLFVTGLTRQVGQPLIFRLERTQLGDLLSQGRIFIP